MKKAAKFYLGMDVSKLWVDIAVQCVIKQSKQPMVTERFDNTTAGMKIMGKWLKKQQVSFDDNSMLVIENTGVYHRLVWEYCSTEGLPLYIGNATHIKWSFGIARGKNDKIDSQRLCSYALKNADELKTTPVLNPVFLKLKDMMTARSRLLAQKNSMKVYLGELKLTNSKETQLIMEQVHKAALEGIVESIKIVEKQIHQMIQQDEAIRNNYELLISVPGIGHLTAVYIICCTNNFICKITGKELASYAGVAPFGNKSGTSIKGRDKVHKMANKDLKKLLHMGAISAITHYPEFKDYYERKVKEGKHAQSVINAVRSKIALRAVAVINNQEKYVDNYKKAA
ncbi:IS110 family RNA-guided transposase [Ferruginibacter sp.]|nr:IS110 family transposase [Ferruginibacter sp.]